MKNIMTIFFFAGNDNCDANISYKYGIYDRCSMVVVTIITCNFKHSSSRNCSTSVNDSNNGDGDNNYDTANDDNANDDIAIEDKANANDKKIIIIIIMLK